MSFWEDDIDDMLSDFGISISIVNSSDTSTSGDSFIAIFEEAQEVYNMQTGEIISARPELICKSDDVLSLEINDVLSINGVSYYIRSIREDGTGITRITVSEN